MNKQRVRMATAGIIALALIGAACGSDGDSSSEPSDTSASTEATGGGEPVYRRAKVTPGAVPGAGRVDTICVKGLLLANTNKLAPVQKQALKELIDKSWAEIHPVGG